MFTKKVKIFDLWNWDVLGIKDPIESKSQREHDREIQETFLQIVRISDENRYKVQLPWLENHPSLNDNCQLTVKRLESPTRKLQTEGRF